MHHLDRLDRLHDVFLTHRARQTVLALLLDLEANGLERMEAIITGISAKLSGQYLMLVVYEQ